MPTERTLLMLLMLVSLLLPAQAAAAAANAGLDPVPPVEPDTCRSIECVTLAAAIASRMNSSADPCQDFYNYACGNFPNIVKYNPLKSAAMARVFPAAPDDFLLEDTIGLMTDKLERNIYEMLVLERVASSPDQDMADLYNFTRVFFRGCRQWLKARDFGGGFNSLNPILFYQLFQGIYRHLSQTIREAQPAGDSVTMETVFAAMVKAGGNGLLQVQLPRFFTTRVVLADDYNLTRTPRASVTVAEGIFSDTDAKPPGRFAKALQFLDDALLHPWEVSFARDKAAAFEEILGDLKSALLRPPGSGSPSAMSFSQSSYSVQELDELTARYLQSDSGSSQQQPFSWSKFFEQLLESPIDPAATVELEYPELVIRLVSFFKAREVTSRAANATEEAAFSDHVTFLIFDWLMSFAAFLPRDTQGDWVRLKTLVLPAEKNDGVAVCMGWTKTLLQPLVERMYQTAYHRQDFKDIQELVALIQAASVASVRSQDWLSDSAKESIVRKVLATRQSIGLDDLTASQLKAFYNGTLRSFRDLMKRPGPQQTLETNFGSLLALARCAYVKKNFDVMSGYSPVSMFLDVNPLVVNAFNYIEQNQIIFPMAILAPPIYHVSYPAYINIGSLGYIIGHEIGHSFDNIGHTIDALGTREHFWDNDTEASYLDRVECVQASYGRLQLYPGGPQHRSNSTIGNDIADIIGIRAAAKALKLLRRGLGGPLATMARLPNLASNLSPEQLVFIQAAQSWCIKSEPHILDFVFGSRLTHSPHHLRVLGMAQNSPEFAEAFQCQAGAAMNPEEKCTFW